MSTMSPRAVGSGQGRARKEGCWGACLSLARRPVPSSRGVWSRDIIVSRYPISERKFLPICSLRGGVPMRPASL